MPDRSCVSRGSVGGLCDLKDEVLFEADLPVRPDLLGDPSLEGKLR
jgi:hypothetical protein